MESASSPLHVVIFPWLAFGHLRPCLHLAERLAARGHRVSFVSTPRNLARLPPVRPALAGLVDLVALPLPRVDGLPDGAEATSDVPSEKFELHRKAFDGLAAPFSAFLDAACAGGKRPDWVFPDCMHHWVAAAAQERGVPCAMLIPCSANVLALPDPPPESSMDHSEAIDQSMVEAQWNTEDYKTVGASGVSLNARLILTLKNSELVALRSCLELEPDAFTILTRIYSKPVVPFGLLPTRPDDGVRKDGEDDETIMRWLDEQPTKSVVYVALGSEAPMSADLLRELAHGLDLAGTRFVWALRKPAGVDHGDSILPEGFVERTGERGLVITRWAPQVSILAHAAVCAFLTHCGWGSAVEGLQFGHPLIMLPIASDQGPNAQFLEGRKVGVAVPRNRKDGSFDRSGVAGAVRAVVVEEEGKTFAANARKLQEIVADREHDERCIDGFIHQLTSWNEPKHNSSDQN
ncbi:UDP-glycosyltransferase 91B1-like [Oryza brachyantha]|uniref:UDP-glycosyltransferase 91B1-like n=1 Tax=Oryza brachyantha TaxID=4533 RepID=UPI001AD9DD33|nr:UDP-glycosyltransferase 91B1-like [Oryza brachyantha]